MKADLRRVLRYVATERRVYRSTSGIWVHNDHGVATRVNNQIETLIKHGYVAEDGHGYFTPTAEGRAELERAAAERDRNHATGGHR